jgi:hypothetical protein
VRQFSNRPFLFFHWNLFLNLNGILIF